MKAKEFSLDKLPLDYTKLSVGQRTKVRLKYVEEQDGKCFYCKHSLKQSAPSHIVNRPINWNLFPPGFLNSPVQLQHNHNTGMTEGAVHAYCNAVMWQYEGR